MVYQYLSTPVDEEMGYGVRPAMIRQFVDSVGLVDVGRKIRPVEEIGRTGVVDDEEARTDTTAILRKLLIKAAPDLVFVKTVVRKISADLGVRQIGRVAD